MGCKHIGYKNVLKTFKSARTLMSPECGLPGLGGSRSRRSLDLLPALLLGGSYDPSSIWFQYFLCKDIDLYCYFFTQGWTQGQYGQYYLYDNLLDDTTGLFAGSTDSNLTTIALLGGLGGGIGQPTGYYPSYGAHPAPAGQGRKRREVEVVDEEDDGSSERKRRTVPACEGDDSSPICAGRKRREEVEEDESNRKRRTTEEEDESNRKRRTIEEEDESTRKRRTTVDEDESNRKRRTTVDEDESNRKRRSTAECDDNDETKPNCKRRKRSSSSSVDCAINKTHPLCTERKRRSTECEGESDPRPECARRRRSADNRDCAENDDKCKDKKRKRRESCEACKKNPDSTDCNKC